MLSDPYILTLTGPSCAGKTTLARRLIESGRFDEAVSVTTRTRREGEINGIDYRFVSRQEFDEMRARGELVEAIEFGGNCYGLPASEFQRIFAEGKNVVAVVEPDGARQVHEYCQRQGWGMESAFVGIQREHQMQRFLGRMLADVRNSDPEKDAKILATYSRRLADMIEVEGSWSDAFPYSHRFSGFNEQTEKAVLAYLL
jgi:guanylate kinase